MFGKKPAKTRRQLPLEEKRTAVVSADRFNAMIAYYTAELKSRLAEIDSLKKQLEIVTRASLRQSERSLELREFKSKSSKP